MVARAESYERVPDMGHKPEVLYRVAALPQQIGENRPTLAFASSA